MNINLIKRNDITTDCKLIEELSSKMRLHPKLTEILVRRGINNETSIQKYLYPDTHNFYDAYLLKGMKNAVDRINQAIKNKEKVVIYGDYDADGVCAAAILSLYLSTRGLDVYTHIPNRAGEGYGLNTESIENIIENCFPDLIITCDCGISGFEEVDYAINLGVDVIVTDHHEVSSIIPQCTVVNPKQSDCSYPDKMLSGAGVALKVVQALEGVETAMQYIDLAAIATVADLVPLVDENRLIVQLGLMELEKNKNLGIKQLLSTLGLSSKLTSADLAFKIAPRINAAGRMGDAYRAFELLTSSDISRVNEILTEINEDNNKRKTICDEMYYEAVADLQFEDMVNSKAIVLSHPSWEKGITGIVAARLTNDFKRPSFVIVNSGENFKGTARGIDGINVYDILVSVSDILIEFGGHSGAAGFSILEKNIPIFKKRVNDYLSSFDKALFLPSLEYDLKICEDEMNIDLVTAMELIEPVGNGNAKPLFKTDFTKLAVSPCKSNYKHTVMTTPAGLQIFAFNFYNQNQTLVGSYPKSLVLELQLNVYNNIRNVKAIMKGVSTVSLPVNEEIAKAAYLKTLNFKTNGSPKFILYKNDELNSLINDNIYGTLVLCGLKKNYEKFIDNFKHFDFINKEYLFLSNKNNYSKIVIAPEFDENLLLYNYNKIIFLEKPLNDGILNYIHKVSKAEIYIPEIDERKEFLNNVSLSRETFGKYYELLRKNENITGNNIYNFYKMLNRTDSQIDIRQFMICITVFSDLKLITIDRDIFKVHINRQSKAELSDSEIYKDLEKLV